MSAKLIAKFAGAAVLAAGAVLAVQTGASAAPAAPSVTVTPTSGLANGSVVQVTATGLTPGGSYVVGECAQPSSQVYPCAHPQQNVTADANGDVSTNVTVYSTFEGYLPDGSDYGSVNRTTSTCVVGLGNSSGQGGGSVITFG